MGIIFSVGTLSINVRPVEAAGATGGVVLDGFGGLHPYGGFSLNVARMAYWPGWDIARSLQVKGDGSGGWVLDGFGGIHAFGDATYIPTPGYWPGWDIARTLVVTSRDSNGILDGRQGYLLDGYGGIHPFGGAPYLVGAPYWPGFDVARGLDIHLDGNFVPDGGAILDAWGGINLFGNYPGITQSPKYYPGKNLYMNLHQVDGKVYAVQRFGRVIDLTGGLTGSWEGYPDWGGWDIIRDDVLVSGTVDGGAQPISTAAAWGFQEVVWSTNLPVPVIMQKYAEDCESAALRVALLEQGTNVSEDFLLAAEGVDARGVPPNGNADAYQNFAGVPYGSQVSGTGYGTYYPSIVRAANAAGHQAIGKEGWTLAELFDQVSLGHPAVVWVMNTFQPSAVKWYTAWDGRAVPYQIGEHTITLKAIDPYNQTVSFTDVGWGITRTLTWGQFDATWSTFNRMAVVVS